jgi:hypothetical protein
MTWRFYIHKVGLKHCIKFQSSTSPILNFSPPRARWLINSRSSILQKIVDLHRYFFFMLAQSKIAHTHTRWHKISYIKFFDIQNTRASVKFYVPCRLYLALVQNQGLEPVLVHMPEPVFTSGSALDTSTLRWLKRRTISNNMITKYGSHS